MGKMRQVPHLNHNTKLRGVPYERISDKAVEY